MKVFRYDHTLTGADVLLFNPLGRIQLKRTDSKHTTENRRKAKCSSRGNPYLKPLLIDQANTLPANKGAKALEEKVQYKNVYCFILPKILKDILQGHACRCTNFLFHC